MVEEENFKVLRMGNSVLVMVEEKKRKERREKRRGREERGGERRGGEERREVREGRQIRSGWGPTYASSTPGTSGSSK